MLSLTKRVDYGLIALTALAGLKGPVSARDMAERFNLSYPLLANVLKDLCNADLVKSLRGKNGGYTIEADPAFVSVKQVVEVLDGPVQLAGCTGVDYAAGCDISPACNIKWSVHKIHEAILNVLGNLTISDIVGHSQVGAKELLVEDGTGQLGFQEVPLNLEV